MRLIAKIATMALMTGLCLTENSCSAYFMQKQVRNSKTVVLDIGHYYAPGRGGQGARTPDKRYGDIEECEFWYRYVGETKKVIEDAGYTCIICNRGAVPTDPGLAAAAKAAGVVQVNTPIPTATYRSKHHPERMAAGMLSADYALDCKPGCIVFLHHNSSSNRWKVYNKGAMYTNVRGENLGWTMARTLNAELMNKALPNRGVPCGVVIRTNGRLGGGDWLNTCNESYVPAAITEAVFLSNPEHAKFLSDPENAKSYARCIGKGIVHYMESR